MSRIMTRDSTIDRRNRANPGIVVTKGYYSFFFSRQVWLGPLRSKMRSSHIVSDAPQALHTRAMNNEISPTRKTAGKAKKKVRGSRVPTFDCKCGYRVVWEIIYVSMAFVKMQWARVSLIIIVAPVLHCAFSIKHNSSLRKSCMKTSVQDSEHSIMQHEYLIPFVVTHF